MKLTTSKKIILVISVVSVLFMSMVVPCFANTAIEPSGGVAQYKPLFYPDYILASSVDGLTCVDMSTVSAIPTSDLGIVGLSYTDSMIYPADGDPDVPVTIYQSTLTKVSNRLTGYSYSYFNCDIEADVRVFTDDIVNYRFGFTDIWLDSSLTRDGQTFDWLSDVTIGEYSYGDPIEANRILVSYEMSYVDPTTDDANMKTVYGSFELTDLHNTRQIAYGLRSVVDDLSYEAKQNGVFFGYVVCDCLGVTNVDTGLICSGRVKYVDAAASGSTKALMKWSKYYKTIVDNHIENPTVLESITRGLNAIWELNIFGTFTIGQIFSACIGVSLFIWILKIFAGG